MLENPDSGLINDDIKPTTDAERHWSVLNMASLWMRCILWSEVSETGLLLLVAYIYYTRVIYDIII